MGIEQTKFGFDNQIRMRSDFCGHPDGYGEAEVRKRQLCEYTLFNNLNNGIAVSQSPLSVCLPKY